MANSSYSHEFLSNFGPAIPDYMLDFVQAPQMSDALKDVIAEKPGRKALDISNLDDARTAISGLMAQVEPTMVETPLGSFSPAKGVGAVFSALGGGPIAAGAGALAGITTAKGAPASLIDPNAPKERAIPVTNTVLDKVTLENEARNLVNFARNPQDTFMIDGEKVSITQQPGPFGTTMETIQGMFDGTPDELRAAAAFRDDLEAKGLMVQNVSVTGETIDGRTTQVTDGRGHPIATGMNEIVQSRSANAEQDDEEDDFDEAQQPEE